MAEETKEPQNGGEEKQFTQADVDRLIGKRLAEERAKMPSKEELDGYRAYRESQQTEAEKLSALTAERDKAVKNYEEVAAEVTRLKHERFLLAHGVPADDLDYYEYKISKLDGASEDFEKVAKVYLKDKLTNKQAPARVDSGAGFGGGNASKSGSSVMNDIIRGATKR